MGTDGTDLIRDWSAANHVLIGIPGFDFAAKSAAEKAELDCRFIELLANIENFFGIVKQEFPDFQGEGSCVPWYAKAVRIILCRSSVGL